MSKLFKLKKWLTLPDAAKRLSISFNEPVSEADLLRLALDGYLTLSVFFPNFAYGKLVTEKQIPYVKHLDMFVSIANAISKGKGAPSQGATDKDKVEYLIQEGMLCESFRGVDVSKITSPMKDFGDVQTLDGVYDLTMQGAEALDVEHRYQFLTQGPKITLSCLDGPLVRDLHGNVYQIQGCLSNGMSQKECQARGLAKPFSDDDYYPADTLPEDSVLVVRTSALIELEESCEDEENDNQPKETVRTTASRWLDVIGALSVLLYETRTHRYRKGVDNINVSGIAESIKDRLQESDLGLSEERLSNLNKDISDALKREPFKTYFSK